MKKMAATWLRWAGGRLTFIWVNGIPPVSGYRINGLLCKRRVVSDLFAKVWECRNIVAAWFCRHPLVVVWFCGSLL